MKSIDTLGLKCPRPLIMLREALDDSRPGDELEILTDNEVSLKNLQAYLKDQEIEVELISEKGIHRLSFIRTEDPVRDHDPAQYCDNGAVDYVVCIRTGLMGEGDPVLGEQLMETFLDHLKLQKNLPDKVLMYNGGVKLALKDTSTCSSLMELEEMGCRIMLCGTCIEYFGIQHDIGVGMISNMVSITESLAASGKVIYP